MSYNEFMRLSRLGVVGLPPAWLDEKAKASIVGQDMALDAASGPLVTMNNNGVPNWLTMYTSPEVVKVLLSRCAAEEIYDPVKNGELWTQTAAFPVLEYTGEVAAYGDYSGEGNSDYNANWPQRQEFAFQTVTKIGDAEAQRMGMAKINAASAKQEASALVLKRARNKIWFFGVAGLKNYGILNDPALPAPIAPPADANGKLKLNEKGADDVYETIRVLFARLQIQTKGLIDDGLKMDAELKLCMSTNVASNLKKKNSFGVTVQQMLADAFPGMKVVTAPEFSTEAGELMQLICPAVDGQRTGQLGYTELLHAHGMVRALSHFEEKKSSGNYGAVIFQPFAVAQMLGV